jgi:hypothetical protein
MFMQQILLFTRDKTDQLQLIMEQGALDDNGIHTSRNHHYRSAKPLSLYLFGDVLLMELTASGELIPVVRKKIYADPERSPSVQAGVRYLTQFYRSRAAIMRSFITMLQDPHFLEQETMEVVREYITAAESTRKSEIVQEMAPATATFPIKRVHLTATGSRGGIYHHVSLRTPGGVEPKFVRSRYDTGAEISLISDSLLKELNARGSGQYVNIMGIDEIAKPSEIVSLEITVGGLKMQCQAAVYPQLHRKVKAHFLMGEDIATTASDHGVDLMKKRIGGSS